MLFAERSSPLEDARELADELGLIRKVWFLNLRCDVPDLVNAADAYVISLAWEGMAMILLEASVYGLPVVPTDVRVNSEVVLSGRTGYIVPLHNPGASVLTLEKMMVG